MTEDDGVLQWSKRREALTMYHPLAPVGCYGESYLRERFARLIAEHEIPLSSMHILDLGSGSGAWCRRFSEIKGTTDGIVGLELDEQALAGARSLSPIGYVRGDMRSLPDAVREHRFDFVTAFVSLMFLRDVSELDTVLRGVREVLSDRGYFLIEEQEAVHDPEAPWSGWPVTQVEARARAAGFTVVARKGLFKRLLNRFDSYYRASFANMDWLRAAERVLPGPYQYYFLLLRKA
jgi:ubiquinone/menaquinone biosynthesis C-methylase UbiE